MPDVLSSNRARGWFLGALCAVLVALCLWVSLQFIEPIPPRRIVLASGPEGSLYHQHAQTYKAMLAKHGVTVEERVTEGPGENLRLLGDPRSGVDIAFVQGGQADSPDAKGVVMLASLYYQPLWIFVRRGEAIDSLAGLAGKSVSIGMPGSGTSVLATPLLVANGVTEASSRLIPTPTPLTQELLRNREVDASLLVGGVRTPAVHAALTDPMLDVVSLAQADAYPQRYPYLSKRWLHHGAIAFVPPVPSRDIALIATEAMLAARDNIHPAIVNLLLETVRDAHDDQGYFEAPGEFPNTEQVDLPVSPDAIRHRRFGSNVLYRHLPFWVATFVERFIIVVLPLLVVVLPVIRYLPWVMNWRMRSRIYRWYGELKLLERDVELRRGMLPIEKWLADLDRLERAVGHIRTPSMFASESYTLREHIDLVRRNVLFKAGATVAPSGSGARSAS